MISTITLNQAEIEILQSLELRTGKSWEELVREALHLLMTSYTSKNRRAALFVAGGLWRDRDDLPDFQTLRRELDRD